MIDSLSMHLHYSTNNAPNLLSLVDYHAVKTPNSTKPGKLEAREVLQVPPPRQS